jgi:hypothetical protein
MLLKMAARGDACRMTFHLGKRSITTFVLGRFLAYGNF